MENENEPPLEQSPLDYAHCFDPKTGHLDVSCRDLDRWPFVLPLAEEIVSLHASVNEFQRIPDEVCACRELRQLFLNCNPIGTIPDSIGTLGRLEWLDLIDTQVRCISPRIGE